MKRKTLIIIPVIIGILGALAFSFKAEPKESKSNSYCNYGQCGYFKSDGYQCRNCAQQGSYYCWSHNHQ